MERKEEERKEWHRPEGDKGMPWGPGCPHRHHPPHRGEGPGPFLPEGEDELSALILRAGHHLMHRVGPRRRGQDQILKILAESETMSQKDLQDALGIQPGSLSEILSKLEGRGLISRQKDEADKRRMVLRLTEEGRARLEEDEKERIPENLYQALTQKEQEELSLLLGKLVESWGRERQEKGLPPG